jgi:hypothetical protein
MKATSQTRSLSRRWRAALHILSGITVLNYLAQIPYYIHFYAVHHVFPAPFAVAFLVVTFALFLAGYLLILRTKPLGGWLLLAFLPLEFGGYLLHNLTGAFLQDLPTNDLLFFTVSLIGYLNFAAAFVYLIFIAIGHRAILFQQGQAARGQQPAGFSTDTSSREAPVEKSS